MVELGWAGSRVQTATARGASLQEARNGAYPRAEGVEWPGGVMRKDIGWRALSGRQAVCLKDKRSPLVLYPRHDGLHEHEDRGIFCFEAIQVPCSTERDTRENCKKHDWFPFLSGLTQCVPQPAIRY